MNQLRTGLVLAGLAYLVAGAASPALADSLGQHCGQIMTSESWTASSPHYVCSAGVTVHNSTLTIAPSAQVFMDEGASLTISSGASLHAVGDQNNYVSFLPNTGDEQPGFWGQIRFEPGAEQSQMNYMTIMAGGRDGAPMVEVRDAVVLINNIEFVMSGGVPLAFTANSLGPSLEAPGQATVPPPWEYVRFRLNEAELIQVLAGEDNPVVDSQTWHNFRVPYRVNETVFVAGPDGPSLRLDRGVVLKFNGDAGVVAGRDAENLGQFETDGTVEKPVVLTSETESAGAWNGIDLTEFSFDNSLFHTRIEYGGRGGRPMLLVQAERTITLELQLRHATDYPLAITAAGVGSFMSGLYASELPVFPDSATGRILVLADEDPVDIPFDAEWGDIGVPYEIEGTLTVAGEDSVAQLNLTGGARLVFDGDEALVIGDPEHGKGALRIQGAIEGLTTVPVVLTGEAGRPGSWGGIRITDDADSAIIDRAIVEYGGAGGGPMIEWGDVPGTMTRTGLRGAAGYPISIQLPQADAVMGEDQRQAGRRNAVMENGINRVLVHSGQTLSANLIVWADPGAPVEFDADVVIASPQTPLVQAYDGLTLLFRPGAGLQLGLNANSRAAFQVQNEAADLPVTLAPADDEVGWDGVRVLQGSTITGEGIVIRGAADGATNLAVEGGRVVLKGLELQGANRGVGLDVTGATGRAEVQESRIENYRIGARASDRGRLQLSRIYLSGNSDWGVLNEDPFLCQVASLVFWGTATGPMDESDAKDGCMNAAYDSPMGQRVSDDVNWWPYAIDAEFTPKEGLPPTPWKLFLPWALQRFEPSPGD